MESARVTFPTPGSSRIRNRAPRRVYDERAMNAVRDLNNSMTMARECTTSMRKLCTLRDSDFFFNVFKKYDESIKARIQDALKLIRKDKKPMVDSAFIDPVYEISGGILQDHNEFLVALSHLRINKPTIFSRALMSLADQLDRDFDWFIRQKYIKANTQYTMVVNNREAEFRKELRSCQVELARLTNAVDFDDMDVRQVIKLLERFKLLNRMFELAFVAIMRPKDSVLAPDPTKTDWHRTFIQLVPMLSHAPLFNDELRRLGNIVPNLTDAVARLCAKLNEIAPIHEELSVFVDKITSFELDDVDHIIDKGASFLPMTKDATKTRVQVLSEMIGVAGNMVDGLRHELAEKTASIEEMKREHERTMTAEKLRLRRKETDEIAKRYRDDMASYMKSIVSQLKTLLRGDFNPCDEDPMRQFNSLFFQLSREINGIRKQSGGDCHISEERLTGLRDKFIEICKNTDDKFECDDSVSIDDLADIACNHSRIPGLKDVTRLAGCSISRADFGDKLKGAVASMKQNSKVMRETLITICNKTSNMNGDELRSKDIRDLCSMAIGGVADGGIYVKETIEPIAKIVADLNTVANPSMHNFLPSSPEFERYLSLVTSMKDKLHRSSPNTVIRPVHALVVRSVELFNTLTIALSSASFAPEYSENQEDISKIIAKYQTSVESVQKLRVLLEEKDSLLRTETAKVRALEGNYTSSSD